MKKSQITMSEDERISLKYDYNYQSYDVCIRIKDKGKYAKHERRRKKLISRAALTIGIIMLLTIVSCTIIDIESKACDLETSNYYVEEFEENLKNEEGKGCYTQKTIYEPVEETFSIQEIRVPMVIAKVEETECVLPKDSSKETEEPLEEEIPKETEGVPTIVVEEYKPMKLSEDKISATEPNANFVYILSEEDMIYIAKLVWMEARGECYEGMVAVAAVVLNRYFSDDPIFYRDSILDTLTQPTQFASISSVTQWDLDNVPDCLRAVEDACKGWDPTRAVFEEGALYFYNPDGVFGYQAEIRQNIKIMEIGNHAFHFDFEKLEG